MAAAPGAPRAVRGFCHHCSKEVKARPLDDGEHHCPLCQQSGFVERLEESPKPGKDTSGPTAPGADATGAGSGRSVPPGDRLNNPDVMGQALANFMTGFANALGSQRQPQPQPEQAAAADRGAGAAAAGGAAAAPATNPLEQLGRTLLGAVRQGIEHSASSTEGLSAQERDWIRSQGSLVAEFAEGPLGLLRETGPIIAFLEAHMGNGWRSQRSGIDEATISKWLAAREVPVSSVLADDKWTCPICLAEADPSSDKVCLICDSPSWHAFHRQCAATWLCHNNSCPICRRSPVVQRED